MLSQEIDFEERINKEIAWFILNVLPRHSAHVSRIKFSLVERGDYEQDEENEAAEDPSVEVEPLTESQKESRREKFAMLEKILGPVEGLDPQLVRRRLVAHLIPLLPNLTAVDFDLVDTPDDVLNPQTEVVAALCAARPQLSDLTLTSAAHSAFSELYLANFLSTFPSLGRLDLAIDQADAVPGGRTALIKALVAMEELETLCLEGCDFVGSEFATAPWKALLEILAISACPNLTCTDFFTLVEKFAKTLDTLEVEEVPTATDKEVEKYLGRPCPFPLPKLTTLVVPGTQFPVSFFHCFQECKLKVIEINFCPQITYQDFVEQVIIPHEATLKGGLIKIGVATYWSVHTLL